MGLLCQSETAFLHNTGQSKCHTDFVVPCLGRTSLKHAFNSICMGT